MPPLPNLTECRAADILTNEQILAVGKVAVEWAMLEFVLHAHGSNMLRMHSNTFWILTRKPDAQTMALTLKELAPKHLPTGTDTEAFFGILARIKDAQDQRNEIIHGVWNSTPAFRPA